MVKVRVPVLRGEDFHNPAGREALERMLRQAVQEGAPMEVRRTLEQLLRQATGGEELPEQPNAEDEDVDAGIDDDGDASHFPVAPSTV